MNWYLVVLKKYADFSGRARRAEYWSFYVVNVVINSILAVIDFVILTQSTSVADILIDFGVPLIVPIFSTIYSLFVLVPSLAVAVRRLHDTNRSGWWWLIAFIPFGGLILLIFLLEDSYPGPNQYGPNPKGIGGQQWGVVGQVKVRQAVAYSEPPALQPQPQARSVPYAGPQAAAAPKMSPAKNTVLDPQAKAWLVVRNGQLSGRQFKLMTGGNNVIGRDPGKADIVVDDGTVSRQHARLKYESGQYVIYDMASTGGTYVNGSSVQRQMLYDNDRIRLGKLELVYKQV